MAARPKAGVDYSLGLDPWKGQLTSRPLRRPVQEPRRNWNDVPASELRHSSGKDGKALTASALYPKGPDQTYAQAQAAANARGAASPLGSGVAKVNEKAASRWRDRARRIKDAEG
jgi:hypothetical protein